MIQIVIAEDEQLERLALHQSLERFLGADCRIELAANGREAVEAVRRTGAEIAVLDIEMPGMSGIEAAHVIRAEAPDCRIIFLTAYSEFGYARQAVELGAVDYLLKPCAEHELRAVITRVLGQVESQRREEKQQELSHRKIENLTQRLEEQLVLTVMGGYLRPERVNSQLEELNITFANGAFVILRSPDGISAERIRGMVKGCGWQAGLHFIMYEYDDSLYVFAVNSILDKDCAELVRERLTELSDQLLGLSRKQLFCAVGGRFDRLEHAQASFYQAQAALGRCTSECRVCGSKREEETPADAQNIDFEDVICHSILKGDTENMIRMLEVMIDGLCAQQLGFRAVTDRIGSRLQLIMTRLQEETGVDYAKKYALHERIGNALELTELREETARVLRELSADVSGIRGGRMTQITQEISEYMGKNYRRDIFLQQVAQEMNYSDAYFSKLFKQCFNKNFITYLTEARVDAAKELLRNPTVNVKEIGAQVGYKDSNYFTKVFRRATGKSPTEYRLDLLSSSHMPEAMPNA